jgi:predicted enzyme related to lactoylglutathione lyase/quinol monooxygenase YgiN
MTTSSKHRTTPKLIGPSFIALQVRDLEASKAFYVDKIGLTASQHNPSGAVVFNTRPVPFAIRTALVDLDATSKLGWGVSLWIGATEADALHAQLAEKGVTIILPPADGPFGRFFAFRDPDGYAITVHTEKPKGPTATLDPTSGYLTLINTFSVEAENADRLVENLRQATEEIFRDQPGFISANLHVSRDRRKVVNYAQWRSKEDYAAMSKLPGIQARMKAGAALATGFDPVDYDLHDVMLGQGE